MSMRLIVLAMSAVALSACQSITPNTTNALFKARQNILSTNQFSHSTQSVLLSAGYTQDSCMADFDDCLQAVHETFLGRSDKFTLVTTAELSYAHSLHLRNQDACHAATDRPPIDPYYANAPLSDAEQQDQAKRRSDCLTNLRHALFNSLKHSYAYLFYDSLNHQNATPSALSEAEILAHDLYHMSINDIISQVYQGSQGAFLDATFQTIYQNDSQLPQVAIATISTDNKNHPTTKDTLHFYLTNTPDYYNPLQDHKNALTDLVSQYDSRLADLDTVSIRSGLGVAFVGSLKDRHTSTIANAIKTNAQSNDLEDDPSQHIHPMGHLLMTGIILPQGDSIAQVLSTHDYHAHFFNPYDTDTINILNKDYPLGANFSASYAMWLSENELGKLGLLNMLSKQDARMPELFMLEPYNPNKRVIIMIHGLASSPNTWVNLTNNLFSDPILRENYQVWQIFYATNLPMLENRYQIHRLIQSAYQQLDPQGTDPASHNSVLIGHSMGGIISRMLISDDDLLPKLRNLDEPNAKNMVTTLATAQHPDSPSPNDQAPSHQHQLNALLSSDIGTNFQDRLSLHALPQVSTAIFISTPFKGTDYADRWFTRGLRRVIRLPLNITQTATQALTNAGTPSASDSLVGGLYLQNGASQLSDQSTFIKLTQDINISPSVRYHSIMGDNTHSDTAQASTAVSDAISDGIVPYTSSHLDGAVSEHIIKGGHSIHENPQTVFYLRQLLHSHLKNLNNPPKIPHNIINP